MYIPKQFQITDKAEAVDFIKRFSFGMMVTTDNNVPIATHIPFVVSENNGTLKLTSHIALANAQHKTLSGNRVLAVFTEPHAYISPSHYEKEESVPTWNYIAVHAYGNVTVIDQLDSKLAALKDMITFYGDADYLKQWDTLSPEYKTKMAKGIVAFEIIVDDLQGQKKLSQNKTAAEKQSIINGLNESGDTAQHNLAAYMTKDDAAHK